MLSLNRLISEEINNYTRLIIEEADKKVVNDKIQFAISANMDNVANHFLQKLIKLKAKATQAGGSMEIETQTYAPQKGELDGCIIFPTPSYFEDDFGNMRVKWINGHFNGKSEYTIFTVVVNTPVAQLEGYSYIGSVVPMSLYINGQNVEEMMVTVSNEYKGDPQIMAAVKASTSKMRCDGCGTNRERGIYHCFLDPQGNVKKFGSNCSAKAFGIDISKNISMIFGALYSLMEPARIGWSDSDYETEYDVSTGARKTSLMDELLRNDVESDEFWNRINRGCTAILVHGVNCKMKMSMDDAIRYEEFVEKIKNECTNRRGNIDYFKYSKMIDEAKAKYPQMFELRRLSSELANEFLANGMEFFYTMEPQNDFEEKVRNIGLYITGAKIYKKTIGKFRNYNNFVPYCVQKYFQAKEAQNPESNVSKPEPIEPFTGVKEFTITIESMDERMTRSGKPYHVVMAITTDNKIAKWKMWSDHKMDIKRGDTIKISATYNQQWGNLENVNRLDEPQVQQPQQQEQEQQEIQYPQDGFRYKSQQFTLTKIQKDFKWFILKNNNDGCEYYVDNLGGGFGYNNPVFLKFNLDGLTQGSTVTATATVASYNKKDGTVGHKLLRLSGIPKDGTPIMGDEYYY